MGLWQRSNPTVGDDITQPSCDTKDDQTSQNEKATGQSSGFKLNKAGDGDEALNLFSSTADVHEAIDPLEEAKVVRKIDLMILPYLAVCYAFFYIDKTTLSYAAIFGKSC